MKEKVNREVLSRYLNSECTTEDQEYLRNLFGSDPASAEFREALKDDWQNLCMQEDLEHHDLDHIYNKLYHNIRRDRHDSGKGIFSSLWNVYSKAAAILFLPLVLSGLLFVLLKSPSIDQEESYAQIYAPRGSRVHFDLPDGTTGWLNSGSTLKYPVRFTDSRDVELSGEAYFDVKRDENIPFIVKAEHLNIAVLGTQFNVSAYPEERNIEVVLESGKIRLNHPECDDYHEMVPNERVVYAKTEHKILSEATVHSEKYSSWREGKLIFRNDPIEEVAKKLARWYNIEIDVNSVTHDDFRLRATFIDEEIEEVMRLIQLTYPIEYRFEKRTKDSEGQFVKRKMMLSLN